MPSTFPDRLAARRRGVALMLVLGVVAIASVLSWAMLSSSAVRNRVDASLADSIEAANQADSGVSVALQYLAYPAQSPVALRQGTWNSFYPGQTGVSMWSNARGATDVSVSNVGDGQFSITSKSTINGLTRTSVARADLTYDRYLVTHALALNGPADISLRNASISGTVLCKGILTYAPGQISNSPAVVPASSNVTAPLADLTLVGETGVASARPVLGTERTYTYDGVTYSAEKVAASYSGTLASTNPDNPLNVWYSDADVTFNNVTLVGTLVVRGNAKLVATGTNVITPARKDVPAVIVTGQLDVKSTTVASQLTVNGVLWVGTSITDSASALQRKSTGWLKVNGALLMGGTSPAISNTVSPIVVTYDASVKQIQNLSTKKTANGIAVRSWKSDTN